MTATVGAKVPDRAPRATLQRTRSDTWLVVTASAWLVVAIAGTVVGVIERWPAQFGGHGTVAGIDTQWMTKGTVLSPPLFMIVALVIAMAAFELIRQRGWRIAAVLLTILVAVVGVIGSLGEVIAAPTPDVPQAVQSLGLIGALLSLALIVTAALMLRRRHP